MQADDNNQQLSPHHYQQIAEMCTDVIWRADLQGRLLYVSPSVEQVTGHSVADCLQKGIFGHLTPDSQEKARRVLEAEIERELSGAPDPMRHRTMELQEYHNTGRLLNVEICATFERDENQKPIGLLGVTRDISQRKLIENLLFQSEQRYREQFEKVYDAYMLLEDEMFVDCNVACLKMFGMAEKQQFLNQHPSDLSPEFQPDGQRSREKATQLIQVALETGNARFEWVHRDLLGHTFHSEVQLTTLRQSGRVRVFAVVRNVSEHKAARDGYLRLSTAIEQTAEAVVVLSRSGEIEYVNPAFTEVTGMGQEDALGRPLNMFDGGLQERSVIQECRQVVRAGRTWRGTFATHDCNGKLLVLDSTVSPVRDAEGRTINFVAVMRNITSEMTLQKQLRQVQRLEAIGSLAGAISHDFNNLLFVITGSVAQLMECELTQEQRGNCEDINSAAQRSSELVRQILTFASRSELQAVPVQVGSIVKEAGRLIRNTLPAGVEMRMHLNDNDAYVKADPTNLHQIIMNLFTNARHAMLDGGGLLEIIHRSIQLAASERTSLSLKHPGSYVELLVRDEGCGIPPELHERIFEPFFTTKDPDKGTGLGLSVIKDIIAGLGGSITVQSQPGSGSTFRVLIPQCNSVGKSGSIQNGELPRGDEAILLVDDDSAICRLMSRMLDGLGYTVHACSSAIDALDRFTVNPFAYDLLITDMHMPQLSGEQLVERFQAIRPELPVITCSGFSSARCVDGECLESGFLCKPISRRDLALAVRRVLDATMVLQ
ncbi:PAS domain S-box protein [bacterium]|nr:PAS domain S-box protein [bacterium]